MVYLDWNRLGALDGEAFRKALPYPWINPANLLTEDGRRRLIAEQPDLGLFHKSVGAERGYGQESHDRYLLEYAPELQLPAPWKDFLAELRSKRYRRFLERLYGRTDLTLRFHWHYAWAGCALSPHTDGPRKIGSHIFYLNDASEWDASWGGHTLVLDDEGAFDWKSAPKFGDFKRAVAAEMLGNVSFLFARTEHSWHGMRPITPPEGKLRKVFIVVIDRKPTLREAARTLLVTARDRILGKAV